MVFSNNELHYCEIRIFCLLSAVVPHPLTVKFVPTAKGEFGREAILTFSFRLKVDDNSKIAKSN
jgi:hypothetical protein